MRKKVAIFGSTGSIGTSTLQVIRNNPHLFEVVTLVAGNNVDLLIEQAKEFMPKYLYIKDASNATKLFDVLKIPMFLSPRKIYSMERLVWKKFHPSTSLILQYLH